MSVKRKREQKGDNHLCVCVCVLRRIPVDNSIRSIRRETKSVARMGPFSPKDEKQGEKKKQEEIPLKGKEDDGKEEKSSFSIFGFRSSFPSSSQTYGVHRFLPVFFAATAWLLLKKRPLFSFCVFFLRHLFSQKGKAMRTERRKQKRSQETEAKKLRITLSIFSLLLSVLSCFLVNSRKNSFLAFFSLPADDASST